MRAEPGAGAGGSGTDVAPASTQDPASAARDRTTTEAAVRRAGADAGGAATMTVKVLPDPGCAVDRGTAAEHPREVGDEGEPDPPPVAGARHGAGHLVEAVEHPE